MNRRFLLLGFALLSGLSAAAAQDAVTDDTPIARAGNTPITKGALTEQLLKYYGRPTLQQLVDRAATKQEAARYQVTVPDAEVNERLAKLKQAPGFDKALEAEGITEDVIKERLRQGLLTEKTADKKWPVKDEDLVRYSVRYVRTNNEGQARMVIRRLKQERQDFRIVVGQDSLDKENDGWVQPNPFARSENPKFFRLVQQQIDKGTLKEGDISREPLAAGGSYVVFKLEAVHPPSALSARDKQTLTGRIRAVRLSGFADLMRKRPVTYPVEWETVVTDVKQPATTVLAKVGTEEITRKELLAYLYENFSKRALDQLVERARVLDLARRHNVVVTGSELGARAAELQKAAGMNFASVLEKEGLTLEAWRERVRFNLLGEKLVNARAPVKPEELVRLTARSIRVTNKEDAQAVIRAAQSGTAWEQLMAQAQDRSDGYLKPKQFLQAERPNEFKLLANVQPGTVLAEPVQSGTGFLVLKLESRLGPESLKGGERDAAISRINAFRMNPLLDQWRNEVQVEYLVPLKTLVASAKA